MSKPKKLKKGAKNIGGTKLPTGAELDPNKDFCLIEDETKGQEAYYKGEKIKYLDYFGELAERETRVESGKVATAMSLGAFSGFGKGKLKKSYYKE